MSTAPESTSVYRDAHPPPSEARWNPRALRAFAYATGSVTLPPLGLIALIAYYNRARAGGDPALIVILGVSTVTMYLACAGIVKAWKVLGELPSLPVPERGRGFALGAIPLGFVGAIFGLMGFFLAWLSTVTFGRGRQLRRRGRILLAPVEAGARWTTASMTLAVDPSQRDAVAAQWRENGRTEHASVAAFARVTLDLMALGAPAALLTAANRDALDEVRHTELCFSLARAIDGRAESPGAFPEAKRVAPRSSSKRLALATLAVDSLIDGALHEGVSARVIATLAKRCDEPAIHPVLKEIAADEGRHAAHGWDVVTWCLHEGGDAVRQSLLGALAALPPTMHSPLPEGASDGSWERWGIHGHALESEAYARTLEDLRARVRRLCA